MKPEIKALLGAAEHQNIVAFNYPTELIVEAVEARYLTYQLVSDGMFGTSHRSNNVLELTHTGRIALVVASRAATDDPDAVLDNDGDCEGAS